MKKIAVLLAIFLFISLACSLTPSALPSATPSPEIAVQISAIPEESLAATVTPEIFIARTQAIPAQVQLSGVTLAVVEASFSSCDLPDCPAAPAGTRYLRVTLQALNLPAGQALDYKNLPQGIAVHDETGAVTPFNRLLAYAPSTQQLALYFTVPETAVVMGLQWPGVAEIPLTVVAVVTPAPLPTQVGVEISFTPLSFLLPPDIASGASGSEQPRQDSPEAAWWQKTPGHLQVNLGDDYVLQGKSHQPQIYVFPAQGYAELLPLAFESMHRLNNILGDPTAPLGLDQLPAAPFFNDVPAFASNIQVITFQNGRGVRFVTQTGQAIAPINNHELFYHFEGLTDDGAYYIVAILPITSPVLPESGDAGAPLPPGGIAFPNLADPNANFPAYQSAVSALLNAQTPDSFMPALNQLDAMLQSMVVAP